jgi:type III pantothenate kinase
MVGVYILILCDIGNTTFHFYDTKKNIFIKIFLDEDLPKKYKNKIIYFISVNQKATKKLKKYYKNSIDVAKMLKFKTKYKGMGIDRQVACSYYKNSIIIDCGSAITVDIMKNGKHKGGFILAGLKAYESMFNSISSKLKYNFDIDINTNQLPLNTKDALSYSTKKSILLTIEDIVEKYRSLNIVITGGDAKKLKKYIKNSVYKKDLLFDSMKEIIYAYNSTAKR